MSGTSKNYLKKNAKRLKLCNGRLFSAFCWKMYICMFVHMHVFVLACTHVKCPWKKGSFSGKQSDKQILLWILMSVFTLSSLLIGTKIILNKITGITLFQIF